MSPEEFNAQHRDMLRTSLPQHAALVRQAVFGEDESEFTRFATDYPGMLAENGMLDEAKVPQVSQMVLAIYRNAEFETYALQFGAEIAEDQRAVDAFSTMFLEPEGLSEEEFDYVYAKYMLDERFIGGGLGLLLKDPDFRVALNLGDDVTAESYMAQARSFAAQATSYEEFREIAVQYGYFGSMVCTWLAACAAVAVAAFAAAVVWAVAYLIVCSNSVSACSAAGIGDRSVAQMLPKQSQHLTSMCLNDSSGTIWILCNAQYGFRRLPLLPGHSSFDLGVSSVVGVIVGGQGNALKTLRVKGDDYEAGCYFLGEGSQSSPCALTITDDGDADSSTQAVTNDAQDAAEKRGVAGFSDLRGGGTLPGINDDRFTMQGAAALIPERFDYAEYAREGVGSERFYRAVVTASTFRMLFEKNSSLLEPKA